MSVMRVRPETLLWMLRFEDLAVRQSLQVDAELNSPRRERRCQIALRPVACLEALARRIRIANKLPLIPCQL